MDPQQHNPCCEARTTGSTLTGREVTYQRCCSKFSEQTWKFVFWPEQNQELQCYKNVWFFSGQFCSKLSTPPKKKQPKTWDGRIFFPSTNGPCRGALCVDSPPDLLKAGWVWGSDKHPTTKKNAPSNPKFFCRGRFWKVHFLPIKTKGWKPKIGGNCRCFSFGKESIIFRFHVSFRGV